MSNKISASEISEIIRIVSGVLEELGLEYHLTGGIASIFYGEPRFTQDIDIVIKLNLEQASELFELCRSDFYCDESAVIDAVKRDGIFQFLHKEYFIKVDFHVGEGVPGEFARSKESEVLPGLVTRIESKEDAILSKLKWVKAGSEKSRQDLHAMFLNPIEYDEDLVVEIAESLEVLDIYQEQKGLVQDTFDQTSGAWKRDEGANEIVKQSKQAFNKSVKRHHK